VIKHILICIGLLSIIFLPYPVSAEDTDKVILPETPPTIEYFKKTTLDIPVLRRQNFVTDPEINSLPAVSVAEFKNLYDQNNPVYIQLGFGSFGTAEGGFLYSSTENWHVGYKTYYTDGEIQQLKKRENIFEWSGERPVSQAFSFRGEILTDEKTIWTQAKNLYDAGAGLALYAGQNMNIKANVNSSLCELKGFNDNHSLKGDLSFVWQPFTDNSFSAYASGQNYSALSNYQDYETYEARYAVMPFSSIVVGAGGSIYKDKLFPEADFTWHMFGRVRLNVVYDPGIDEKSYAGLCFNNYYELPDNGIMFPEKSFSLKERIECYFSQSSSCSFEVSQINYKNYIYRAEVPGSSFVSLYNFASSDKYVANCTFSYKDVFNHVSKTLSVSYNSDNDMPFVPEFSADASIGYNGKNWSFVVGYAYVSSLFYALGDPGKIPQSGDLSFAAGKNFANGVEAQLKFSNLLSDTIETQPAFISKSPTVELVFKIKF